MIYSRNKSSVNLQDIFNSADKNDSWAQELLHDLITWFSIGFQNILLVFNPEVFIISGDYRKCWKIFQRKAFIQYGEPKYCKDEEMCQY